MRHIPIVKVCYGQPKLHIGIVLPGCKGPRLLDLGVELHITPIICCEPPHETIIFWDCAKERQRPHEEHKPDLGIPTLIYPAFEIDDEGRIVFYFDSKLWSMHQGRYMATVKSKRHKEPLVTFHIDLCNEHPIIDQIAQTSILPCGEEVC